MSGPKRSKDPDQPDLCGLSISDIVEKQRAATLTTADTRGPPDVTKNTRVIAILGVYEDTEDPEGASPLVGDGWLVSDFYL